jgi:transposase
MPRGIFTERLPVLVEPYARKTTRLREVLELVVFTLGGEGGASLIDLIPWPRRKRLANY